MISKLSKLPNRSNLQIFLLVIGFIILLQTLKPTIGGDGAIRYESIRVLLVREVPDISYSILQPLLSIPLVKFAQITNYPELVIVAYFNFLIFTIFSLIAFFLIKSIWNKQIATLTLLLLIGASMFPHNLQNYYGEVLTSVFMALGFLLISKNWLFSSVFIAIATLNTPAILPAIICVLFYLIYKQKNYKWLLTAIVIIFLVLGENFLKFGSLFGSPYLSNAGFPTVLPYSGLPGFSYPLFFGVLSILLSFGKGVVFYIPGLLLFGNKDLRASFNKEINHFAVWLVFGVLLVLVYAQWWSWYGGNYWGPRFFLPLSFPAALAIAIFLDKSHKLPSFFVIGLLVTTLSFWVGINGYIYGQHEMDICWQNNYAIEAFCWYVPEFSALWRPFVTNEIYNLFNYERSSFAVWQIITFIYLTYLMILGSCSNKSLKS